MKTSRVLVPGTATGAALALDEPLSFWGGFDSADGRIIDRFHPQHGECLAGRIVFMERGRGSSSGASVLAEAIRLGTAPAAICLLSGDAIIATGALVAAMLYGLHCPVIVMEDAAAWRQAAKGGRLTISAAEDGAVRLSVA